MNKHLYSVLFLYAITFGLCSANPYQEGFAQQLQDMHSAYLNDQKQGLESINSRRLLEGLSNKINCFMRGKRSNFKFLKGMSNFYFEAQCEFRASPYLFPPQLLNHLSEHASMIEKEIKSLQQTVKTFPSSAS